MAIKLKQGDGCVVPVKISVNGAQISVDDVEKVEFRTGEIRKVYPETVTYDRETGAFLMPLDQEDTFRLPADGAVRFDVRVKFKGGAVIGTQKVTVIVTLDALSEEVI